MLLLLWFQNFHKFVYYTKAKKLDDCDKISPVKIHFSLHINLILT